MPTKKTTNLFSYISIKEIFALVRRFVAPEKKID